jgi:predicted acylesterase/phospholipase RssA
MVEQKRLAHIGILKAIDSAGLKIDYITAAPGVL